MSLVACRDLRSSLSSDELLFVNLLSLNVRTATLTFPNEARDLDNQLSPNRSEEVVADDSI